MVFFYNTSLCLCTLIKNFQFLHWLQTNKLFKHIACISATSVETICLHTVVLLWNFQDAKIPEYFWHNINTKALEKMINIVSEKVGSFSLPCWLRLQFIANLNLQVRGAFVQPLLRSRLAWRGRGSGTSLGWQEGQRGSQNQGKSGNTIWGRQIILWILLYLPTTSA